MEGPEDKGTFSPKRASVTTRSKRNKKPKLDNVDDTKPAKSTVKHDDSSLDVAPTATVMANKEKQELAFLKEKLEWQRMKIKELEGERDFLRSQLSSLTKPKEEPFHDLLPSKASESSESESSSTSSSVMSVLSSSSSSPKKQKRKIKKKHSRAKKYKKEQKKFRQRVQTPPDIVQRYKSLLKTFLKTKTMTKAFQKHGIDRNTVVSTSSVGEVAIAVPNVYEELLSNRLSGETVLAFAKRCEAAIQGNDEVKSKIESMKANGTLLPIRRSKSV